MAGKRELIEPHEGDERYVRRDESGQFSETDDEGRSLARDNDRDARPISEPGQGDRGDRTRKGDSMSSGGSKSSSSRGSGSMRGAAARRNQDGSSGSSGSSNG
jgi:hypothetical protein